MAYSADPPPWRRLLGRLQGVVAGVNTDGLFTRHGETPNVAAGVEILVAGHSTPKEGIKLHQVQVYGTAPAAWSVYIGGVLRRTQNTNIGQPSMTIPFAGIRTAPFDVIEVKVQHSETTAQDFSCDLELEEVPLGHR